MLWGISRTQSSKYVYLNYGFGNMLDEENGKGAVFKVVRQMMGTKRDVVGGGCVKDANGKIEVDDKRVLNVWKEHYDKISNVEFHWSRNSLTEVDAVSGPSELKSTDEFRKAIAKMKSNRAAGPSGVVADMLKAAGESGVEWVADVCNAVVTEG